MRFRNNDNIRSSRDLTDAVTKEHPKHFIAVAEQQIREMHSHKDGSPVELHQVGSQEFIQQSIRNSLEGKIGDVSSDFGSGRSESNKDNLAAAKIEYERKSAQNQAGQQAVYGAQQSVTGAARQETAMMGCNCGAEWTVTGQSTKADSSNPAAGVNIEQYGSTLGGAAGYNVSSGAGGERIRYAASGSQQQEYKS